MNRIFGEPLRPEAPRHLAAENSANHTISVTDVELGFDLFSPFQGRRREIEQNLIVQGIFQPVVLFNLAIASDLRSDPRLIENR